MLEEVSVKNKKGVSEIMVMLKAEMKYMVAQGKSIEVG